VKISIKATRTFLKLDQVIQVFGKEMMQISQDSHGLVLKWMERGVKNSLSSMDGISDNDDLRDISLGYGLVDATSNSKHLSFCTGDECSMMESLDERLVGNVHV